MVSWLKFYFLGFFNDNYGKEGATRSFLNVLLSLLLTLLLLGGGISAGYAASFGTHYQNAEEFRGFLYSVFASNSEERIDISIRDGKLTADIPDLESVNTFKDEEDNSANGYRIIVDTRPAETAFDDFTLICKDANGVEISYDDYRNLPEEGRQNGSVSFKYSGNALDVTAKQTQYVEFLDKISDENGAEFNGEVAASYSELKHNKSTGEISDKEYADGIYTLYAKTYYPDYSNLEIYGAAPTLRTYYMQAELTEGKDKYVILLDDLCICAFKTKDGIPVDFGSYYSGVADAVITVDGMAVDEMQANVDNFIKNCFSASGGFNFLVHLMNTGKFILLLTLAIFVLALIAFIACRILHLQFGLKYFGTVKIIGGYLFYSALLTFVLEIILSFECARKTVFFVSEIVIMVSMLLRTLALFIAELIRKKRTDSNEKVSNQ